ncbi:MAG: ABC transporter substrate-binding protein, partial [Chloroflexi bacterium]|nr:ABC transporter substrate-binding protein [Chloroflexota bacterium]
MIVWKKHLLFVLALFLGLVVMLGACGGDDQVVPGVTDDEILLGTHTSLTGPIAVYSQIGNSTKAYFDFINDTKGGINGRKIRYILEDDAYSPPKTVDLVRKLVEQDQIFALVNGLGTPTHLQVVDYLLERGVPDLFVATGAIEWVK